MSANIPPAPSAAAGGTSAGGAGGAGICPAERNEARKGEQLVAQSMKTTSIQKMNNILKVFVFDRDIWGILGLTLVLVQSLIYHLPQPLFVLAPHLVVQQSTCAVPCGHGML